MALTSKKIRVCQTINLCAKSVNGIIRLGVHTFKKYPCMYRGPLKAKFTDR